MTHVAALQVGYITSEIWREGETSFSLDHNVSDVHDANGSTLCAAPAALHPSADVHSRFRYISSMVVHPSQRGKRLGESYVVRLIAQVGLPLAAADAVVVLASANALAAP